MALSTSSGATAASSLILGSRSTVYSAPRYSSVCPFWRPKPRTSVTVIPWTPTVVAATNDLEIAQEEVFGPVVTVTPFEDEKDAIRLANDVRYGLMATVWTGEPARGHRIASRIKAGTVGINMPYTAFPGIPFGGYKQSGFGRELGLETLDLYLETKSVIVSTGSRPINPFGL